MLNGFWTIDITDFRGLKAHGLALLRDGAVLADGEALDIAGTYEVQGNAIMAALDVVLRGRDASNRPVAERVHLQVQGHAMGHVVSASGIDLSDAGHRADVRLECRAILERDRTPMPAARNDTVADARGGSNKVNSSGVGDRMAAPPRPRFAKARLPGEIREEARDALAALALRQRGVMAVRHASPRVADDAPVGAGWS